MKTIRKRWKIWAVIGIILLAAVVLVTIPALAPDTSSLVLEPETSPEASAACLRHTTSSDCLRLPTFSGENLLGDEILFPDVFASGYALVVVYFSREQQDRVGAWLPLAEELEQTYPDLTFYGIPLFSDVPAYVRVMATTGLRMALDNGVHDNIVMVFLEDREAFLAAMDIPDFDNIQVFIMDADGIVLWRTGGDFTEEKAAEVRQQMALLAGG
jgi:hypothetical protein